MGSCRPPKTAFLDSDLAQLEWVYAEVCAALEGERGRIEETTKAWGG
jgi:hypothetical protein